jgi:hypothetical protein
MPKCRVAEYVYAKELGWDQRVREGGRDEQKRMLNSARKQAKEDGEEPDEIHPWWQYRCRASRPGIQAEPLHSHENPKAPDATVSSVSIYPVARECSGSS